MQKQDLPYVIATALGLAIAVGSGFYMFVFSAAQLPSIFVAVLSLGVSQAILLIWTSRRAVFNADDHSEMFSELAASQRTINDSKSHTDFLRNRIDVSRQEMTRDRETVANGFSELKESYASLLKNMQRTNIYSSPEQFVPDFVQPQFAEAQPMIQQQQASPFGDQLAVSLEPIIDLSTGRTAHYRMHLALLDAQGGEMASDMFLHHAERINARPALDIFIAREADTLLRKLRQRDPHLNIFMPIGASTLASSESVAQINADRKSAADVSAGLIFEFPHAMLAGLTDKALEGLASLARQGARFALSNVSISGLDLVAMNTLNVHFVSLDASAIDPQKGPSLAMASFTQTARASRVQMIVSAVADHQIINKLPQITRLVSGPCFAAPRRIKQDVLENAAAAIPAAA